MKITITKAEGLKCERCWRIVPEVCNLNICARCTEVCQRDGWIEGDLNAVEPRSFTLTQKFIDATT